MKKEDKRLKLGFIGGGIESAVGYSHFVASKMDNRWNLVSGCFSLSKENNIDSAITYGVAKDRVYSDWQEFLQQEKNKIDAVSVLVPTPAHYEIVKKCLELEIPIICEKSITSNIDEANSIASLVKEKNGFLVVTYNYSCYPMVREARHLIKKDKIGKIIHFQIEMPQEGFIKLNNQNQLPKPQQWRLNDNEIPTIYLDLASHLHQLIYFLTRQNPIEVIADHKGFGFFKDKVIDNVISICKYTNDIQGQFWFSKSAIGNRNGLKIRIFGEKGSLEWHQMVPEELFLFLNDGSRIILDRASKVEVANQNIFNRFKPGHPDGFLEAFANLYFDIANCLEEYKKNKKWHSDNVFGIDVALEGMLLLQAMSKSVNSKSWESVR